MQLLLLHHDKRVGTEKWQNVVSIFRFSHRFVLYVTIAVAARQCMADASGVERWIQVDKIPVPPLADAPTWNWLYCRGFCKPTTLTLSDAQKKGRHTTYVLSSFYFFIWLSSPH